jgi:hypothetical protein
MRLLMYDFFLCDDFTLSRYFLLNDAVGKLHNKSQIELLNLNGAPIRCPIGINYANEA